MRIKMYENIKKANEATEGILVKVLKLRLIGIQVRIFELRLRGESVGRIKKSLNIEGTVFFEADEIVKKEIRDYRQEARKWYNATETQKNQIELLYQHSLLQRYSDMSLEERKEYFGVEEIPESYRKGAETFLKFLLE